MASTNDDRWTAISTEYRKSLERNREAFHSSIALAGMLRREIVRACGCEDRHISFHRYEYGAEPKFDTSTSVAGAAEALVFDEEIATFGLGILLEPSGEFSGPKTEVVIPITLRGIRNGPMGVESPALQGRHSVSSNNYAELAKSFGDAFAEGVLDLVTSWTGASRTKEIGFYAR